jgi:2,3-dihydroxybiphenyl 1,2-dioxygenase
MTAVTQLGYLGIGAKDIVAWRNYAEGLLGLEVAGTDPDGTVRLRLDEHEQRFFLHEDARDDVLYVGWQTDDKASLDAIGAKLESAGIEVTAGTSDEAERRRVRELIKFTDPDGLDCEVSYGPAMAATPFASAKADARFVAGDQGLGHVVFATPDLQATMSFYCDVLGMKVSDYVTKGALKLGFLHCNERHHSLAFAQVPATLPKRTNHFMLQLDSIDTVGRAYDKVVDGAAPLLVTMGRHPNDEMVSFYVANPSQFGIEYGWGARTIDDSCWEVTEYHQTSTWGHRSPRPRPQT